jgi:cadmium resistance protein CadD (predicted permease)
MLYFLGVIFVGIGVYCLYKAWSTEQQREENEEIAHKTLGVLPIIGNVDRYQRRSAFHKNGSEEH